MKSNRRLSAMQLKVLLLVNAGRPYHLEERERRSSRTLSLKALRRHELIHPGASPDAWELTDFGRQHVPAVTPRPSAQAGAT